MTQEEKAKAYDEAVKVAKSKIKNDKDHVLYENDVLDIFPELKESVDEQIRKALIEGFKVMKDNSYVGCTFSNYNIPVTDIIAWLEKQGEQKPVELYPIFRIGDIIERKDGQGTHLRITSIPGNFYHCIKMIYSEDDTPFCDIPFKNQDEFQISSDFKQKPAWSEEDEEYLDDIIRTLRNFVSTGGSEAKRYTEEEINWLKSKCK